jgi:hypothetical protein
MGYGRIYEKRFHFLIEKRGGRFNPALAGIDEIVVGAKKGATKSRDLLPRQGPSLGDEG